MKIVRNDKLINRNSKIGQFTSLGALLVLGAGMYISFTKPEWFTYSLIALLLGFTMTQVGMYYGNRWGRNPRPYEELDAGLKGLPGDYVIYHYSTPASHLLVGPAGVWVLMPYRQRGRVVYEKNRWKLSGGGFVQSYMSIFGQEGLGRPDIEAASEIEAVKKFLKKQMDESEIPEIRGVLVFTNADAQIEANDSPIPAMQIKKLKDFIRQKAKEQPLGQLVLQNIKAVLPEE
jgi:hypothetical protein